MKLYYKDDEHYPATYSFKDEVDGTTGSDIDFVSADDSSANCSLIIISDLDGHNKVLQVYDNNGGGIVDGYHTISAAQTNGTIEFWMRSSDITKVHYQIYRDSGATEIFRFGIHGNNLQYYDGAWHVIVGAANDTWYHIRIDFRCDGAAAYEGLAENDWHVYIDGTHYGDYNFDNNQANMKSFRILTGTANAGYYGYYDAFGYSWDTDYDVGDNEQDWSWTQISNVLEYPTIVSRLDRIGTCSFSVRDKLGALYSTWKDLDFTPFIVEDDSDNVIFRGYIVDKKFTHNTLNVIAKGIGIRLEWKGFNHNYVLAEGKVAAPIPYAGTDIPMPAEIVRPTGDDGNTWTFPMAPTTIHDVTDNIVTQPDINTDDSAYAINGDDGESQTLDMGTITCTKVTEVKVWILGYRSVGVSDDATVDINLGGWEGPEPLPFDEDSNAWHSINFTGLAGSQADMNGLQIKITAASAIDGAELFRVYIVYAEIEYEHSSVNALEVKEDDPENDDPSFTWDPSQWYEAGVIDNGLLIVDNTSGMTTRNWSATAVEDNGTAITESGNHTDLTDKVDANYWEITDTGDIPAAITAEITCGGVVIDNANKLKAIRISLHAALYTYDWGSPKTSGTLKMFIKKDTDWGDPIFTLSRSYSTGAGANFAWWGVGIDGEGNLIDDIVIEDTDAELQKYFDTDGAADYDELKGVKFELTGVIGNTTANVVGIVVNYINVAVDYHTEDISPIMVPIHGSGASFIYNTTTIWDESGVGEDDYFKIGENTDQIVSDIASDSDLNFRVDTTLTKYIARWYKGTFCIDIVKDICQLEGLHWWEDYANNELVLAAETDFVDSTVNLANADCLWGWKIHDKPNQIKQINVFGNAALRIYAFARDVDTTNVSPIDKNIINDKILTVPDAQEIADEALLELKSKRLQIEIPLQGLNTNLTVGKTLDFDIDNPDIDNTFSISKVKRTKGGYIGTDDIWTTVYIGLGSTDIDEFITDTINDINAQARRNAQDRLSSTPYSTSGASIQWSDIAGADAGAVAATSEVVKSPIKYPLIMVGGNGFVEDDVSYGGCQLVAFNDVNASINTSFWVHDGGSFKIRIIHSGSGANFAKTIGGIYYISYDVNEGAQTWDAGPIDMNILADQANVLNVDDSAASYTIADNSKVGIHYAKDDNAGGAAGNMYVYGILLVRQ